MATTKTLEDAETRTFLNLLVDTGHIDRITAIKVKRGDFRLMRHKDAENLRTVVVIKDILNKKLVTSFFIDDDEKFSDRHGETDMSNKFLPFIVENSTPLHILKTLLSRSKGMNEVLVASILYLVLEEDIKKLRKL
jgi:hypothetical protein